MGTALPRAFGRIVGTVALSMMVLALAACGSAAEPQPTATPPATAASTAAAMNEEAPSSTEAPSAKAAPAFELPNAAGETISLASYAGDKNVVLVFYRGFW